MDWVDRVLGVRRWTRGGERAPHKPLLLLYALGAYQRHGAAPIPFSAAEASLQRLLREFGPPRHTHMGYPFHHLAADDRLWQVDTDDGPGSPGSNPGALRSTRARGRLHPELTAALDADPRLLGRLARALLEANFAPSLHDDVCQEAGLDLAGAELPVAVESRLPPRDPAFRWEVLEAYGFRCAFCDYDGLLDGVAVGLDAAHVRWRSYEGPDEAANGLCLCALHHRLLDRGVLGLTPDREITVSHGFRATAPTASLLVLDLSGRPVRPPRSGRPTVEAGHIAWHTDQVFRRPARAPAA
ncbi:phosphorothioated DNA-binding restriction endonuclease [Thermomonospora umbrina]|uniref:Putative restriction endonuclease n=1 Tax=Thermomonospora umbrina TaxID=111806 RepID=A0A3D9SG96_9ACTN|nr:HNH endonuclease [Thermomonospora umbrina]REE94919.1 putative restriction endonuclease [Thermomonospora umbrina]